MASLVASLRSHQSLGGIGSARKHRPADCRQPLPPGGPQNATAEVDDQQLTAGFQPSEQLHVGCTASGHPQPREHRPPRNPFRYKGRTDMPRGKGPDIRHMQGRPAIADRSGLASTTAEAIATRPRSTRSARPAKQSSRGPARDDSLATGALAGVRRPGRLDSRERDHADLVGGVIALDGEGWRRSGNPGDRFARKESRHRGRCRCCSWSEAATRTRSPV